MSKRQPNVPASIHRRLLNIAKARGEDFEAVLTRFALERLLHRLASSDHRDEFLLKGALLFVAWADQPFRSTRDLDLLGSGAPDLERLAGIFRELCLVTVLEEGLEYDAGSVRARRIREDQIHEGCRVTFIARLGKARIRIQVDIGFGDAVTPAPEVMQFPTLLDHEPPTIRVYPKETVVAEKLEAMVSLAIGNSRMKDFFDLWILARHFAFDGAVLARALAATFERRGTAAPRSTPIALRSDFATDPTKAVQWAAFHRKLGPGHPEALAQLEDVVSDLETFLWPPLRSIAIDSFHKRWKPGGPWAQ